MRTWPPWGPAWLSPPQLQLQQPQQPPPQLQQQPPQLQQQQLQRASRGANSWAKQKVKVTLDNLAIHFLCHFFFPMYFLDYKHLNINKIAWLSRILMFTIFLFFLFYQKQHKNDRHHFDDFDVTCWPCTLSLSQLDDKCREHENIRHHPHPHPSLSTSPSSSSTFFSSSSSPAYSSPPCKIHFQSQVTSFWKNACSQNKLVLSKFSK